jgi:hypothetical protein
MKFEYNLENFVSTGNRRHVDFCCKICFGSSLAMYFTAGKASGNPKTWCSNAMLESCSCPH